MTHDEATRILSQIERDISGMSAGELREMADRYIASANRLWLQLEEPAGDLAIQTAAALRWKADSMEQGK